MPKQPQEKSAHLQELEAVFDRHTRRFSPFEVLGLRPREQETAALRGAEAEVPVDPTHTPVDPTHTPVDPTHTPVDPTDSTVRLEKSDVRTPTNVAPTPLWVGATHTRVVVVKNTTTPDPDPTHTPVDPTPRSHETPAVQGPPTSPDGPWHDVLTATQLRAHLGKKARQVLGYLNRLRSLDRPASTVPVGYGQISATAAVHPHYLRRNVLPKLAMLGLIGIGHKSLQGTIYHLHYEAAFLSIVAGEEAEPHAALLPEPPTLTPQRLPFSPEPVAPVPPWIDREHWGWLTPEIVHQLVTKAGSEVQAQEKLAMIRYNETHGPVERHVRDRRAVLVHYLHTPHADIWPNDDGFETLALRRARQEREQAVQEKALAEEALRARQEAATVRFLAALADTQRQWLKQEAKQRVDAQPGARFLTSRYPLYKAEEEQLIAAWMDRMEYGESVPHVASKPGERLAEARGKP